MDYQHPERGLEYYAEQIFKIFFSLDIFFTTRTVDAPLLSTIGHLRLMVKSGLLKFWIVNSWWPRSINIQSWIDDDQLCTVESWPSIVDYLPLTINICTTNILNINLNVGGKMLLKFSKFSNCWVFFLQLNRSWPAAINTWSFAVDGQKRTVKIRPTIVDYQCLYCQHLMVHIHQHLTMNGWWSTVNC